MDDKDTGAAVKNFNNNRMGGGSAPGPGPTTTNRRNINDLGTASVAVMPGPQLSLRQHPDNSTTYSSRSTAAVPLKPEIPRHVVMEKIAAGMVQRRKKRLGEGGGVAPAGIELSSVNNQHPSPSLQQPSPSSSVASAPPSIIAAAAAATPPPTTIPKASTTTASRPIDLRGLLASDKRDGSKTEPSNSGTAMTMTPPPFPQDKKKKGAKEASGSAPHQSAVAAAAASKPRRKYNPPKQKPIQPGRVEKHLIKVSLEGSSEAPVVAVIPPKPIRTYSRKSKNALQNIPPPPTATATPPASHDHTYAHAIQGTSSDLVVAPIQPPPEAPQAPPPPPPPILPVPPEMETVKPESPPSSSEDQVSVVGEDGVTTEQEHVMEDNDDDMEETTINPEAIDEGVMEEDGLSIRGINGEKFVILNLDSISIQDEEDVEAVDSSEGQAEADVVIAPAKSPPQTQTQVVDLASEVDDDDDDDDTANGRSGTSEADVKTPPALPDETEPEEMDAKSEANFCSETVESITMGLGMMMSPIGDQQGTGEDKITQIQDEEEESQMEVDQEEEDPRPSSRLIKRRPRKLSSLDGDADSDPLPDSQEIPGSQESETMSRSPVTETRADNQEGCGGTPSRRATRSSTAAANPSQPSPISAASSVKGNWTYRDESTDDDDHDQDSGSARMKDESPVKPNSERYNSARIRRGGSHGRGRSRKNGRAGHLPAPPPVKTSSSISTKTGRKNGEHPKLESVGQWKVPSQEKESTTNPGLPPSYQPQYSKEERERLYADRCFVIDVNDIGSGPENTFLWQIDDGGRRLRQYYPAKFSQRQFHTSTSTCWYFFAEDFKGEEFYKRFQPVVVIVASSKVCFPSSKYSDEMLDQVIQYVYIDRCFFRRMAKNIGRIHETEYLRNDFVESLPVYTMLALVPDFITKVTDNWDKPAVKKFHRYLECWRKMDDFCWELIRLGQENTGMSEAFLTHLILFPDLTYSWRDIDEEFPCKACELGVPIVRLITKKEMYGAVPYNPKTLEEFPPQACKVPEELLYLCRACCVDLKKLHQFYHFRYNLLGLVKQNMAKDVEVFRGANAEVTDTMLIWLMKTERSWQNAMFLDFQVRAAELVAQFGNRSQTKGAANAEPMK